MFTPKGRGGYEQADVTGCYSFMTTEELLNGAYLLTGYVIATDDVSWGAKNRSVFEDVLISMENRDHYDAAKRDGIIKGESDTVGTWALKSPSASDVLDSHSHAPFAREHLHRGKNLVLGDSPGCAFTMLGNASRSQSAHARMAEKTAATLTTAFSRERGCWPANLYDGGESKVIAVLEPLAIGYFLGMEREMNSYAEFIACLKNHAETCLREGNCIDSTSGGLRLSSASTNSWPSKGILCLYVIEELMKVRIEARYPTLVREVAAWMQIAAKESTVADQINVSERTLMAGAYYPRVITSSLWIRPRMS